MCTDEADIDRAKRNEIPQLIIDAEALSTEPISDRWVSDLCNVEGTSKKVSCFLGITAAVAAGKPIRLECFVDDPFSTIGGTERRRPTWLMVIVLLWLTLGF